MMKSVEWPQTHKHTYRVTPEETYFYFEFQGIIAPHSVADVPLLIKANALEEQEVPCLVQIFGSQDLPIVSHTFLLFLSLILIPFVFLSYRLEVFA